MKTLLAKLATLDTEPIDPEIDLYVYTLIWVFYSMVTTDFKEITYPHSPVLFFDAKSLKETSALSTNTIDLSKLIEPTPLSDIKQNIHSVLNNISFSAQPNQPPNPVSIATQIIESYIEIINIYIQNNKISNVEPYLIFLDILFDLNRGLIYKVINSILINARNEEFLDAAFCIINDSLLLLPFKIKGLKTKTRQSLLLGLTVYVFTMITSDFFGLNISRDINIEELHELKDIDDLLSLPPYLIFHNKATPESFI